MKQHQEQVPYLKAYIFYIVFSIIMFFVVAIPIIGLASLVCKVAGVEREVLNPFIPYFRSVSSIVIGFFVFRAVIRNEILSCFTGEKKATVNQAQNKALNRTSESHERLSESGQSNRSANEMKKNPTRVLLLAFTIFYGVVGIARLYFFFRPAYYPTDFRFSLVGIAGNLLGLAICAFLIFDAPDRPARLFWLIAAASSVLNFTFRIGLFWSLSSHGNLIASLHFIALAIISACFLAMYKWKRFTLFGERSRRVIGIVQEQNINLNRIFKTAASLWF